MSYIVSLSYILSMLFVLSLCPFLSWRQGALVSLIWQPWEIHRTDHLKTWARAVCQLALASWATWLTIETLSLKMSLLTTFPAHTTFFPWRWGWALELSSKVSILRWLWLPWSSLPLPSRIRFIYFAADLLQQGVKLAQKFLNTII